MSSSSADFLNKVLTDPAFHDYLAILKGARNGFVYGVKVRFPHALIMAILFGRGDWTSRTKHIYQATKTHALNLAKFVTLYKLLILLQKKANSGKERSLDTFIAGLIGGYVVFGKRSAINEQIVLYVCSRVVASFLPREPGAAASSSAAKKPLHPDSKWFSLFAAVSWGAVMWTFKEREQTLQSGMFNSMVYLYRDSEYWNNLRTLLWVNK